MDANVDPAVAMEESTWGLAPSFVARVLTADEALSSPLASKVFVPARAARARACKRRPRSKARTVAPDWASSSHARFQVTGWPTFDLAAAAAYHVGQGSP